MKAYYLSVDGFDDQGGAVVFAENYKQAITSWNCELEYDSWLDRRCKRVPIFDGMEKSSDFEMKLVMWRNGWWFDTATQPKSPDESSEKDFEDWYLKEIGVVA